MTEINILPLIEAENEEVKQMKQKKQMKHVKTDELDMYVESRY